jgi:hypothetical protein
LSPISAFHDDDDGDDDVEHRAEFEFSDGSSYCRSSGCSIGC